MYSSSFSLSPLLRIGVLRGGSSSQYNISLESGRQVLEYLSETHKPLDIFISREGLWYMNGIEKSPERILKNVDVVFNALYGVHGRGVVQEILDSVGVSYTGSGRFSSAMAINKWITKERARAVGIKTPVSIVVRREDNINEKAREIFNTIPHPLLVKPTCGDSSIDVYITRNFNELLSVLEQVLSIHGSALVEEYISGKETLCGVIDNFRNQKIYTLPLDGNFSLQEKKEIEKISVLIHRTLCLSGYSQSGFIVSPRRGVYFLEVNTLPELTNKSPLSKSLTSVGSNLKEFIHHVIGLALHSR